MIKINNVNKYYNKGKSNEIHVLNNISLELPDTSLVTILGKSGSGKSTLLNVIGGLDKANGSFDYNNDLNFEKYSSKKIDSYRNNNIGYIFQNYHLIEELTVYENLVYSLELIGITNKEEVDSKIDKALELVNMKTYKRRNSLALSGGQQQRVAIARALVKGAKILIADEPTGNLDSKNTIDVMNILKTISNTCLVLLVTHDKEIANSYADRVINLVDGSVVSDEVIYTNNSLVSLNDDIYLDQLENNNIKLNESNINIYGKTNSKLDINVYIKNNVVYVDVDTPLQTKILGVNSNVQIKEEKPNVEDIVNIDTTLFENNNFHRNNYFYYFINKLIISFKMFFKSSKKQKLIYMIFALAGFLISFNLSVLSSNLNINEDDLLSSDNYESVYLKLNQNYDMFFTEKYKDVVVAPSYSNQGYFPIEIEYEFSQRIEVGSGFIFTSNQHYSNLEYKNELNDNEIILTKYCAQALIESMSGYKNINKNDLLNSYVIIEDMYFKVVAIEDHIENKSIIFNLHNFFYFTNENYKVNSKIENIYYIKEDVEKLGVVFDDFVGGDNSNVNYYTNILSEQTTKVNVVSTNLLPDMSVIFVTEQDYINYFSNLYFNENFIIYRDVDLVEGNMPIKYNEILIPYLLKDTEFENNLLKYYSITGYYNLDSGEFPDLICSLNVYMFSSLYDYQRVSSYYTNDMDFLLEEIFDSCYYKDYILDNMFYHNFNENKSAITTVCITLILVIALLFFTGRTKMISKIKTIGIYRALGSSKMKIYLSFVSESIAFITLTTLLTYIGVYIIIHIITIEIAAFSIYVVPFQYFLLGIICLYSIMIIASLLPIFTLLRKTPIEITSKYDI